MGGFGCGFWFGGGGDDGEDLEGGDGVTGDVETLGVGADIGWEEEEAAVFEEVVEEGEVEGGESFQQVAADEGEAEPEAFAAGASEEGAAGEAFGIEFVGEVEVADEGDRADGGERERDDPAFEIEEVDSCGIGGQETRDREVAGMEGVGLSRGSAAADDDFLAGAWHNGWVAGAGGLLHGTAMSSKKGARS